MCDVGSLLQQADNGRILDSLQLCKPSMSWPKKVSSDLEFCHLVSIRGKKKLFFLSRPIEVSSEFLGEKQKCDIPSLV